METILVIDDSIAVLQIVKDVLNEKYNVLLANGSIMAKKFLAKKNIDLILLDLWMPEENGMELLEEIYKNEKYRDIPVVFLTSEVDSKIEAQCIELGAEDFVNKPIAPKVLMARIVRILENRQFKKYLEEKVREKQSEAELMSLQAIKTIVNMIDAKDAYTKGHSQRVANYSSKLGKALGLNTDEILRVYVIALLHDIGKIGIPERILKKSNQLTDEEYEIMKTHTIIGGEILKDIKSFKEIDSGAIYHHENYDGTGYPFGKKGEEIPLIGRIIAIADVYDAMTSDRCYRKALPFDVVYDEIKKSSGTKFDPILSEKFLEMLKDGFIKE